MKIAECNGKFWLLHPLRSEGLKPDDDLIAYGEWALEDLRGSEPLGPFATLGDAERALYYAGDKWPDAIKSVPQPPLRINKIKRAPE